MHTDKRIGALEQATGSHDIGAVMHPLRTLMDVAYAAIEPFIASVEDETWGRVFGLRLSIHGGCELRVDNERLGKACDDIEVGGITDELGILVPMVVKDPYYPDIGIVVPLGVLILKCNRLESAHNGPLHVRGRSRCAHGKYPHSEPGCLSCVFKWWQEMAGTIGLLERKAV